MSKARGLVEFKIICMANRWGKRGNKKLYFVIFQITFQLSPLGGIRVQTKPINIKLSQIENNSKTLFKISITCHWWYLISQLQYIHQTSQCNGCENREIIGYSIVTYIHTSTYQYNPTPKLLWGECHSSRWLNLGHLMNSARLR